jgi:hypothetical protein
MPKTFVEAVGIFFSGSRPFFQVPPDKRRSEIACDPIRK